METGLNEQDQPLHGYLGDVHDVEDTLVLLEAGQTLKLPLLSLPGLILFPGATLPLRLRARALQSTIDHALAAAPPLARLLVVVYTHTGGGRVRNVLDPRADLTRHVGCVAEIRQAGDGVVIARGRQRACVNLSPNSSEGPVDHGEYALVHVTLLSDDPPPAAPAAARQGAAWWPPAMLQHWDPATLAVEACSLLSRVAPRVVPQYARDPMRLSFWLARNLPLDERTRQQLLEEPSVTHRLRHEVSLLRSLGPISCGRCSGEVASCAGLLHLSSDGPGNSFVNPLSWVFHVVTVDRAECQLVGEHTQADSWFPGYAWSCAYCECGRHLGWHFRAAQPKPGSPAEFVGLVMSSVAATRRQQDSDGNQRSDNDDENEASVAVLLTDDL